MSPENFNDDLQIETLDEVLSQKEESPKLVSAAKNLGKLATGGVDPRHIARTAARVGETIMGLPGDIKELFSDIMVSIPESIAGEELPNWRQAVRGTPEAGFAGGFGLGEPTSGDLRSGISQQLGGEFLEPQNELEQFGDDIAQDFAALALPVKGKVPFAKALGTSIIANSGGEVAKQFFGETGKDVTKLGLMFASGIIGKKGGVKKYINNLYADMEAAVPEGATTSSKTLSSKLDNIESMLKKGDPTDTSKIPGFKKISAIRDKMKSGVIDVEEVVELTKSTNEAIFELGELKRSENQLYSIRRALHDTAKEYGSENKDFLGKLHSANEAHAATETSRRISNWVRKNVKPRDYVHAAGALGLEGIAFGAPATAATVGAGAALGATAYSAEVMKRIAQSPSLRKYYMNVINTSLKENKAGFMRSIKHLDDGLKESFEENPFETVEFD